MTLDVLICKELMANAEKSPVRTFTLFPKQVTFTPWYGQLELENTLRWLLNMPITDANM